MDQFQALLDLLADIIWGPYVLIPLLLGTGLWLSIRLSGIQFRKLGPALRLAFIDRKDPEAEGGDVSHFQALTTALAATVGVGNIVGVATALVAGGPGALFWMWVTGLVGMASKYAEAFAAVRFRRTDKRGESNGGPQLYLTKAIPGSIGKVLAVCFAIFAVLASFGIGNMTQANAVTENMAATFGVNSTVLGLIIAVLVGLVVVGGIRSIGRVTAALVPMMIVFYVLGATYILIVNAGAIPEAFGAIFTQAFTGPRPVAGGAAAGIMIAIQMGVARGIFSNESGMGSAAIAAAAAKTTHPVRQGLVSMTQTFIDTIVVVTFTGLVLITTGVLDSGESPALLTGMAFSHGLPGDWGNIIVTIGVVLFAFSTILGWSYYGDRCIEMLFGVKATLVYRLVFTVVVYIGATIPLQLVWTFADVMNGLMALPNLIGLLVLSGLIARETAYYLKNDPKLHASKSEIDTFMAGHPGAIDSDPA